jgi:hypothetical protein
MYKHYDEGFTRWVLMIPKRGRFAKSPNIPVFLTKFFALCLIVVWLRGVLDIVLEPANNSGDTHGLRRF